MEICQLRIPEVLLIKTKQHGDSRGFFSEVYNQQSFLEAGLDLHFVQDNHSFTASKNVIRGLHYQIDPFAQDKLVRVLSGSIMDIALDIRKGSPTFGDYVSKIISAENFEQILVPKGFAHGFITLENNTSVSYKVTNFYSPISDRGIRWNDSDLKIDWGANESDVLLSDKDSSQPFFRDIKDFF